MVVCPNCGAGNEGGKFCQNCGSPLPEPQPVAPQVQPVQQEYQQPVYAQPVETHHAQPVATRELVVPENKYCKLGLLFTIIGIFCMGITCPIGLVLSIIGLIDSKKKNEPGSGKAIAGIIVSSIIIVSMVVGLPEILKEYGMLLS